MLKGTKKLLKIQKKYKNTKENDACEEHISLVTI